MKRRRVVYSDPALSDLLRIQNFISEVVSVDAAIRVTDRLTDHIGGLKVAAERGQDRSDIRANLRVTPFERAVIALMVDDDEVLILRIFYGGEDWEGALTNDG